MQDDDSLKRVSGTRAGDRLLRPLPVFAVLVVVSLIALMSFFGSSDVPVDPPAVLHSSSSLATSAASSQSIATPGTDRVPTPAPGSAPDAICGLPGVEAPLEARAMEDPRLAARVDAASNRLAAVLVASRDDHEKVVGLMFSGQLAQALAFPATTAEQDGCGDDAQCERRQQTAVLAKSAEAMAPFTDAVARIAAGSSDPFVYAVAVESCASDGLGRPAAPACQLVSPEQWTRIDPDNAYAWLHVAAAADARGDASALDDAMRHLAITSVDRVYSDQAAGIAAAAIPPDADTFERAQMQRAALIFAPLFMPPVSPLTMYCSKAALADGNRSQVCDGIAHRLVDHSTTLLERIIGVSVGGRVGWSSDSLTGLRLEDAALQWALAMGQDAPASDGCGAAEAMARYAVNRRRYGEVGSARAAIAASGKSMAAFSADAEAAVKGMQLRSAASAVGDNALLPASSPPPS